MIGSRDAVGLRQALVVAQPVSPEDEMDPALHDRAVAEGLAEVERRGISGKDVTPFLLGRLHERTEGASLVLGA